jgi:hypothetical protein
MKAPFLFQVLVQFLAELRLFVVLFGRLGPHLGQQDLQRRSNGRVTILQQIVGDDLGQTVFDR